MFSKGLAVCILLFLSISSFVDCAIWEPPNPAKELVCRTDTCLKRGKEYFDNLNSAVNPCDDFYSFACGGWYIQNKPPEFLAEWNIHNVMEQRVIKDLKEILEKPANPSDRELVQVKYFYDICMKIPFLGRLNPKDVAKHITTVGRFGKKKLWDIHQNYLQLTGESAFFGYSTNSYPDMDLMPLIVLRDVKSAYGAINHNDWKTQEENNYSQFLFLLMKSLQLPGSDSDLREKIKAVLNFRKELDQLSNLSKEVPMMKLNPKTARDYQKWFRFKDPRGGKPRHPEMPWEKIIKSILSVAPKKYLDKPVTIMREEMYFRELESLLSSTSEEVLVDNMEIFFAERHTVLTSAWEDLLEKTAIEPSDLEQPIRQDVPRYVSCIRGLNMWPQIGKLLQRKWFRKDIVPPMQQLVSGLQTSMVSQVQGSTWLNPQTKADTVKRIQDIKSWIGYPPWYSDPTNPDNPKLTLPENDPLRADAYLDLRTFVTYIKSPMLRPPAFDPDIPNVYNLGAIGYVVGHELYHVVHDCGMYIGKKGRLLWWPPEMHLRCREQIECFVDAFNNEKQRVFELTYHEKLQGGNKLTYLEDVPDVMGLDAAFRLYQALKKKDVKVCQTLPRFEKYSCEQMFFIAYANTMCGKMTSKAAKNHIETSKHSLDNVRVNGAVMHNKEFAKAFQCPKAKPMNPDIKCNLWT